MPESEVATSDHPTPPTPPSHASRWSPEAVSKLLAHPLVLLLVTAAVSGLLVPRLTQQWQEQQEEINIRRDFAARVSRAVGEFFISTQLAQVGAQSQSQEEFDEAYVRWEVESAVLGAELRAYYTAEAVHADWARCDELATAYYVQVGIGEPEERRRYLQQIQQNLRVRAAVDLTDIPALRAEVLAARDRVIRGILAERMA